MWRGHGLVAIEDPHAPPVLVALGEGQNEAVECVAAHVGPGGCAHLYLKSDALKARRPAGPVIMDIEVVELDVVRGPGTEGWLGWRSLVNEREHGDHWLEEADDRRKQLETFDTMRKTTDDAIGAVQQVTDQVHRFAVNAERRYRRLLQWAEEELTTDPTSEKMWVEKQLAAMGLADAVVLSHWHFGEAAQSPPSEEDQKALDEARALLEDAFARCEEKGNTNMAYDCMKLSVQVAIQACDVSEGRSWLERMSKLRPGDENLKSDGARLNRLESALTLKQGAGTVKSLQVDLQTAVAAKDLEACSKVLSSLEELMKANEVKYDIVKDLKVGKDVGNAMKLGNQDVALQARKVVSEIQRLAQRGGIGL